MQNTKKGSINTNQLETATLAGGCFWYTEAIFKRLKGVVSITSGYTGEDYKKLLKIFKTVVLEKRAIH